MIRWFHLVLKGKENYTELYVEGHFLCIEKRLGKATAEEISNAT